MQITQIIIASFTLAAFAVAAPIAVADAAPVADAGPDAAPDGV